MRNYSPNRSRDNSRNFRSGSSHRGRNMSPPPPPSTSSFRNQREKPSGGIKSRLNPPLRSSIRSAGSRIGRASGNSRLLRRNDLRGGLIAKRSAPVNRAKDYAKKIRQARMKLNERSGSSERHRSSSKGKEKTPKKESGDVKQENEEEDYLAIANDVNFDEDENEAKSVASEIKKEVEGEKKEEPSTSAKDDTKSTRHRSQSKEIDYICVQCEMHLSSAQVRIL